MAKLFLKGTSKHPFATDERMQKQVLSSRDLIETLKMIRKELHISQDELARLVNLNRQSISNIERGEVDPQLTNILEMLKLCGIKVILDYPKSKGTKYHDSK